MNSLKAINTIMQDHERRISALEKGRTSKVVRTLKQEIESSDHSGPKGGTLLLIREGVFRKRRSVDEVKTALEKKGYIYHKDVVRNTLNRLSRTRGPLTTINEGKSKVYVERK